jgi:hypothetical protein
MISKKLYPFILLITSCAQIVTPGGGPKDDEAPKVKSSLPANKTTSFSQSKITINFDEFVEIKKPEQIVISPYIKEKPTIESDGKSIVIDLKKSILEKDKTYTINFGNSISDNHEGKTLENFSYCFSTGSFIDSLAIEGTIVNALNLKPEKEITVGLYNIENYDDSTVMKNYPSYLSQTNEDGKFLISNLPPSKFYLFAFKDENKNLKYEKIEDVAFIVNPIESSYPQTKTKLFLSQATLHNKNKILDTLNREPGVYTLAIYQPEKVEFIMKRDNKNTYSRWQHNENQIDTLFIYSKQKIDSSTSSFQVKIAEKEETIEFRNRKKIKNSALELKVNRDLSIKDTVKLSSNYPIDSIRAKTIIVKQDTLLIEAKIVQVDNFNWTINFKKEESKIYEIQIKDSTIQDIWGRYNKGLKTNIQMKNAKETGTISLNIINNSKENYLIQLVSGDDKEIINKEIINSKSEVVLFDYLNPIEIRVKVIKDSNKNGKWDRANYSEKTQAEEVAYLDQKITIRAFWDIEQSLDIQKIFNK